LSDLFTFIPLRLHFFAHLAYFTYAIVFFLCNTNNLSASAATVNGINSKFESYLDALEVAYTHIDERPIQPLRALLRSIADFTLDSIANNTGCIACANEVLENKQYIRALEQRIESLELQLMATTQLVQTLTHFIQVVDETNIKVVATDSITLESQSVKVAAGGVLDLRGNYVIFNLGTLPVARVSSLVSDTGTILTGTGNILV